MDYKTKLRVVKSAKLCKFCGESITWGFSKRFKEKPTNFDGSLHICFQKRIEKTQTTIFRQGDEQ